MQGSMKPGGCRLGLRIAENGKWRAAGQGERRFILGADARAHIASVENKRPDQINNFTSDQEQYRPYQIVKLLLKL
jgi:hypothetical protein